MFQHHSFKGINRSGNRYMMIISNLQYWACRQSVLGLKLLRRTDVSMTTVQVSCFHNQAAEVSKGFFKSSGKRWVTQM